MGKIKAGTILIEESAILPASLRLETEPYCSSGWRLVRNLDGYGLDRQIREAGWTFFLLAGEVKTGVLGFDAEKMTLKAINRLLANLKSEQLNCLEITHLALKHFLGLSHVSISARSRHIQENMFLSRAARFGERERLNLRPNPTSASPIPVSGEVSPVSLPSEVKTVGIA